MFESSRDIFNILIGVSVAIVAIMVAAVFYNLMLIIRDFRSLSKSIKDKMQLVDSLLNTGKDILETIQAKVENSSKYLGLMIELVSKIVDHLKKDKNNSQPDKPNQLDGNN